MEKYTIEEASRILKENFDLGDEYCDACFMCDDICPAHFGASESFVYVEGMLKKLGTNLDNVYSLMNIVEKSKDL